MSVYAKKIESIRNHYAHKIKTHPYNAAIYVEFALFEELLNEYERAREIYEKATTNNHNNTNLWKKYACFELRRCDTNRCRSILEQGVQTNPREISLWLFFVEVEKDMENVKGVIDIYNRMVAENDTEEGYWHLYMFYSMVDRRLAEEILEKMDNRFGSTKIKVEKLIKMSDISAVESLMKQWDCIDEKTYVKVVEVLEQRKLLQDAFQFIKRGKYRFGSSFFKHKYRIMRKVIADEDDNAHCSKLLCEAALLEKKQDLSGAEQIYKCLLRVINREYRTKSFVKYSKFLVRREELQLARKNYGKAIAQHLDVYEEYLSMERVLGDKARIRRIYEKYLQDSYMDARVWLELIEFEESMGEVERAEYLFENALKVLKNGVDIIEQEYNKRKYKK